jgi:hypothetical protein
MKVTQLRRAQTLLLAASIACGAWTCVAAPASATTPVVFMPGLTQQDLEFMIHEVGVAQSPDFPGLAAAATQMEVVAVDLDRDSRLELFVRFGEHDYCEQNDCTVMLFLRTAKSWRPILNVRARSIAIARESFDRMPNLMINGAIAWRFTGRLYHPKASME